jgi:hypothetical protein
MTTKTADPERDLLHGTAVQTRIVLIDPTRVTRYSAVRPISHHAVASILQSLKESKTFEVQYAVTGVIDADNGDVYIRDGAHRIMAVLKGRQEEPDVFDSMMVPMIVVESQESNESCEALLAFNSNLQCEIRKTTTFADHVAFIGRILETSHSAKFAEDKKSLESRTWSEIVSWTSDHSDTISREQVRKILDKRDLNPIFNIVKAMLPRPRLCCSSPLSTPDSRAWEMFFTCTSDSKCPASGSMPFPDITDVLGNPSEPGSSSTRAASDNHDQADPSSNGSLSRRALDCPFFRGNFRNSPQNAESRAFSTEEQATVFEKVLFMSEIHHMRQVQRPVKPNGGRGGTKPIKKQKHAGFAYFQSSDTSHGQRVGFAVRCVVKAWNFIATALGYEDVDEMLAPYIQFDLTTASYAAITHTHVWAPHAQSTSLLHGESMCGNQESLTGKAKEADEAMHSQLRTVAAQFLTDVRNTATDKRLFGDTFSAAAVASEIRKAFCAGTSRESLAPSLQQRLRGLPAISSRLQNSLAQQIAEPQGSDAPVLSRNRTPAVHAETAAQSIHDPPAADREVTSRSVLNSQAPTAQERVSPPTTRLRSRMTTTSITSGRTPPRVSRPLAGSRASAPQEKVMVPSDAQGTSVEDHAASSQPPFASIANTVQHGGSLQQTHPEAGRPPSESSSLQSDEETVRLKMAKYSSCYPVSFRALVKTHLETCNEDLTGKVQLVLTDPPYNTRSDRDLPNSEHDVLGPEDLVDAAKLIASLLRPGGHAVIFCSTQQFEAWTRELQKDASMMVDTMPFLFLRTPTFYTQDPRRKTTNLFNMCEWGVHATKQGAGKPGHDMVAYKPFGYVTSRFKGWCNVIDNILKPAARELVWTKTVADDNGTDISRQIRFEQKSELLMCELISRFSMPLDTVVDLFSGTYTTAAACLNIKGGLYRRFVGSERDESCHNISINRILKAFKVQYMKGCFGEQDEKMCRIFNSNCPPTNLAPLWTPPKGCSAFCFLPEHILRFLGILCPELILADSLREKPADQWSEEQLEELEDVSPAVLRALDCMHFNVTVKPSLIIGAGDGLFATRAFAIGERIGWYNGTHVYRDLSKGDYSLVRLYGPRVLWCTVERFRKYGLQLSEKINDQTVFIVPPEYCSATMINDPRSCQGDQTLNKRVANVAFQQSTVTKETLVDPFVVEVITLRSIDENEELLIDYGSSFTAWSSTASR